MHHFKRHLTNNQVTTLWGGGIFAFGSIALATAFTLNAPSPAQAQAAYGSYVGGGVAIGVTSASGQNENANTTGFFGVRYKFLRAPVSLRTQVLVGGSGAATVPTVSYDIPLNWQTDLYLGAGASIISGDKTPVGNRTGFVLQPGIDYALPNSNFSLFGNAIISFGAYESNNGTAASIQAGAGLRF